MCGKCKKQIVKNLFKEFVEELDIKNLDIERIIQDADCEIEDSWHAPWRKDFEECARHALATYFKDWAEDWGED